MGLSGKSTTEINTEVYLTFHLKVRASHLNAQTHPQYQQFLYQEITDLRKKGWTMRQTAGLASPPAQRVKSNKKEEPTPEYGNTGHCGVVSSGGI